MQQLRILKLIIQTKPLISLNPRSPHCLLWKRWPREVPDVNPDLTRPGTRSERSGRSGSARPNVGILSAQQALANAEEANEEMLKDRLEKIQQVMNQAALAGLEVEPQGS